MGFWGFGSQPATVSALQVGHVRDDVRLSSLVGLSWAVVPDNPTSARTPGIGRKSDVRPHCKPTSPQRRVTVRGDPWALRAPLVGYGAASTTDPTR